jgi:hypothetical protein
MDIRRVDAVAGMEALNVATRSAGATPVVQETSLALNAVMAGGAERGDAHAGDADATAGDAATGAPSARTARPPVSIMRHVTAL